MVVRQDTHLTTNQYDHVSCTCNLFLHRHCICADTTGLYLLGSRFVRLRLSIYARLGTIFYLSYLLFEFPQNLALQRFPVGKWIRYVFLAVPLMYPKHISSTSINIFVWGIAVACMAACKNFTGLFVLRFILGICEGSITAGFMIVNSMFYTRSEQMLRLGYWSKYMLYSGVRSQLITLLDLMDGTGGCGLFISLFCINATCAGFQL
jgi:MFS family permease